MWRLKEPACTSKAVFSLCISKVKSASLRTRLQSVQGDVVLASKSYRKAAKRQRLHKVVPSASVGGVVSAEEMVAVYTQRMAKKGAPGRPVYDALISAPANGVCPLCGQRGVTMLDHHLPKAHFPVLAITPSNLVPSCSDCNKAKLDRVPSSAGDVTLHPYFDDVDQRRWLQAKVIRGAPAALLYFVKPPLNWKKVTKTRLREHFSVLGLGDLYASHSAEELLSIRFQLNLIHASGGPKAVRSELRARAESCRHSRRNGWRAAAYAAWSRSKWFCDGGFDS